MSDPKPLKFARVKEEVRAPSWLPGKDKPAQDVNRLEPPRVQVDEISGAEYREDADQGPTTIDWAVAANHNASLVPEPAAPSVSSEQYAALEEQLAAAHAELAAAQAKVQAQQAEIAQYRNEFVRAAVDLATARTEVVASIETQLLSLSVEIAEAILEEELQARPELHANFVDAALEQLAGERRVTLRCSPDAYDPIVETFGGTEFEVKRTRIEVVVDQALSGLGCILEGQNRRVDARLSERLDSIRGALLAENRKRSEAAS